MAFAAPPHFADQIDASQFQVPDSAALGAGIKGQQADIAGIHNDWSGVNSALDQFAPQQAAANALANGQGLTAGTEARMGQQNLGEVGGDTQSLGKALMALGSKKSSGQAVQVAGAQGQQQVQAAQKATALQEAEQQARMHIYQSELQLQNQKFAMQQQTQKLSSGINIANLQLQNLFNNLVANANNAEDLGQIRKQHDDFNQTMMYVGAAMQGTSAAAAGGTSIMQGINDPVSGWASSASASDKNLAAMYDSDSAGTTNNALQAAGSKFYNGGS